MKRREVIRLGAAAATLGVTGLGFGGKLSAQQKMVMKASDVHPLGYPTVEAVERLGKKLEQQSNGRYSIQMFPSMQLGGEKEAVEQAQVGALQFARISVGVIGPIVDELNVFNMPFVFRDVKHMRAVIDGPIGTELLGKITNNAQTRLVALCWMDGGARSVYNKVRPIRTPEDLKGLKLRIWESKTAIETWRGLGANTIVVPRPEMYLAFKQGIIEGGPETIGIAYDQKNAEVAKYWTRTDEYFQIVNVMMNEKKYSSLKADQRKIMHQAAQAGARAYAAESERGFTDKKAKAIKDFGVTILEPDLGPWRKQAEGVLVKLEAEGVIPKGLAAKAKALK